VHITRVSTISTLHTQLSHAYAAYVAGDLETAIGAYQDVLAKTPRQVDALLGLAAIELARNRFADAHIHYQQVLIEQPEHPTATAALYLIEGVERPGVEAKLKLLLDRGIDAPYIHFALGNTYARKERWTDAQVAYFNALHGSPNNADYAYNLAVSLDHLQQSKSALTYYQLAKQAARAGHVAFNPAAVDARIAALTNALAPSTQ